MRTIKLMTDASFDESSRQARVAMVALWDGQRRLALTRSLDGLDCSAQAEYEAAAWAVQYLLDQGLAGCRLRLCTDHQPLWRELFGLNAPPRKSRLLRAFQRLRQALQRFRAFECEWIPRALNEADALMR
ncbi:MAG TPA: reverse transcriptase-like protein [Candidatus Nitrosotenuis sp.]|jgi:ribonuclease HI|nr:reverse transcriptase-like protein [Candidatus Nitrosotenuis sp.]